MKYSPLMNHQQQNMNKIQKIPIDEINEEPTQYDGANNFILFNSLIQYNSHNIFFYF